MSLPDVPGIVTAVELAATVDTIAHAQLPDGLIPWFEGGHADPWDHVETAMALDLGGRRTEAERAYEWMVAHQETDGSWAAYYQDGGISDYTFDANVTAYIAVGAWHHYLLTGDLGFLETIWPTVDRAIGFVLELQRPRGEIAWARDRYGVAWHYALLTGSSSMHHSLRCAMAISRRLSQEHPRYERPLWELATRSLAHALNQHPEAFDPRERWSMDWYYPILGGALRGQDAKERIEEGWSTFVVEGLGVRCVSDRPWITGAETCECALALDVAGRRDEALLLFSWMQHLRSDDGAYWTGAVFPEMARYPEEQSTWTAAAVVLAAEALAGTGPTSGLFRGEGLPEAAGTDTAFSTHR